MEKGSVSIHFVHAALAPVLACGSDTQALLQAAGIASSRLDSPHSRVSAHSYARLWLAVAQALNDEFFAQDTHGMKVGSFAMLCRLLVHCKTLQQALLRMLQFFNLLLDDYQCHLQQHKGKYAQLVIQVPHADPAQRIFGHETLLIMMHGVASWLIGRRMTIARADFAYAKPDYYEEYHRMYSAELLFDAAFTTLSFEHSYLALPVIQTETTVRQFLQQAPHNIVIKYKNNASISAKVRRQLRQTTQHHSADFDQIAAHLNMARSTLRRRLKHEGQSFQAIKDQVRCDQAIHYLTHANKNILDIAVLLGFAEPSAFYRAFKKWTGTSPAAYRQQLLNNTVTNNSTSPQLKPSTGLPSIKHGDSV